MHAVFPVVMIVIGAEVVLNFLLGLYRPRTADESPRPAMDSRILSFIAAPDRLAESIGGALNYQFGFNVTDSWFYQLVSRWLAALLFVGALVVWLMTSLAVVQPNQQGIVLRFGALHGHTLLPGLHVKAPWPIDTLETIDATTVRSVQLANDPPKVNKSILWTNEHGVPEAFFPVQPSAVQKHTATGEDAQQVISDLALVSVEVPLYYVVSDYEKFRALATPEQRDQVMRAVGRRELFEYLATQTVDEVLGEKRQAISEEVAKRINTRLAAMNGGQGAGVTVRFVGLVGVHPPRQTAAMFESVVQNNQTRAANIQAARAYADSELIKVAGSVEKARALVTLIDEIQTKTERLQQMPQAAAGAETSERRALADEVKKLELKAVESISQGKGSAADLLLEVRAARWERHMQQRASAESYGARLAAYHAAPQVYKAQLYFQTLQEVMAQSRVYIVADDGQKVEMRLNLEDSAVSNTVFDAPKALGENK
jgi:regulator of protease activity HflC (stomatin/prohibitin superfamily)